MAMTVEYISKFAVYDWVNNSREGTRNSKQTKKSWQINVYLIEHEMKSTDL